MKILKKKIENMLTSYSKELKKVSVNQLFILPFAFLYLTFNVPHYLKVLIAVE